MKDAIAGSSMKLTDQQVQEAIGDYRRQRAAKREEERNEDGGEERKEGGSVPGREQDEARRSRRWT